MKKSCRHLIVLFILLSASAYGQSDFWNKVKVRKAFESKTDDDTKPANFSFTIPRDSARSYLFNGGIGVDVLNLFNKGKLENTLTAFAVYNRNTLIDKKQNNYKIGVTAGHSFEVTEQPLFVIFGSTSLQYMRNYIDTTHSLIITNYWRPMYKKEGALTLGGYKLTDKVINYFLSPQIGWEYQNIIDANLKQKKGYDARGVFGIGLNVMIKRKAYYNTDELRQNLTDSLSGTTDWGKRGLKDVVAHVHQTIPNKTRKLMEKRYWPMLFEFLISFTGRASLFNYNSNYEKHITLFTAGFNFYPMHNENFSIGYSYNTGSNPIDGTLKQTYWLLTINFKK